jgi:hypothetical protein
MRSDSDENLKRALAQWKARAPSPGLADSIVRHATAQPQRLPLGMQWREIVASGAELVATHCFRSAGMAAAALCVVAVLGFSTGYFTNSDEETANSEMDDIIAVDMGWLEEV